MDVLICESPESRLVTTGRVAICLDLSIMEKRAQFQYRLDDLASHIAARASGLCFIEQ
jgi:hypothetical protein